MSASWKASRSDSFGAQLEASRSLFSSGEDDAILTVTASWRHVLGRDLESTLGAGMGWAATRDGATASSTTSYPVATAAITRRFRPARVETNLSFVLSPNVDRLNGTVSEWLQGTAGVTWSPARRLTFRGRVGATQTFGGSRSGSLAFVFDEVGVSYRLSALVELDGGFRSGWTQAPREDASSSFLWVAFAGVKLRAPPVHF
jgi:hypothetical protein